MSQRPISRSDDLKRLRDEGYDLEIRAGHLLVKQVPYANADKKVERGVLVMPLTLAGEVTTAPDTHVAYFIGAAPCDRNGNRLERIINGSNRQTLAPGLEVDHYFSSKPASGRYEDYCEKVTTYVAILSSPARSLDPDATAQTFPVIEDREGESVFNYIDTASSRARIGAVTPRLEVSRVAIVGLGGTGAYVLDFVAKTPVKEIHLFDGDVFLSHNAFRAPGAAAVEELEPQPKKVAYYAQRYSRMRRGVVPHEYHIDASTAEELRGMDFVFLCMKGGDAKRLVVAKLEEFGIDFVDAGMGVYEVDGSLAGVLRITTSTAGHRDVRGKETMFSDGADDEYARNIQIADLNALSACLAVIRWKKLRGFYLDLEHEHLTTYTIDGNQLANEDKA